MDLPLAVRSELGSSNRLLPPRWSDLALLNYIDEVAGWIDSVMKREIQIDAEGVLLARKLGRGARPLSLLGLKERLIYRGAVSLIERDVGLPDRSRETHEAFLRAPLGSEDCRYVLKADVASYYQFVDHERLVDEVVAQVGDDLAVGLAVELLREATGRRFGLPQLSSASDTLAEIYIEPIRRVVAREGFPVWRFADDLRVSCRSYEEALAALEITDHAARELGLILNEMKTSTPGRRTYEMSLTAQDRAEADLFEELEIEELEEPEGGDYLNLGPPTADLPRALLAEDEFDEADMVPHGEEDAQEGISEAQLHAASKVLNSWVAEEEDEETQRAERAHITARLLGRALRVFALAQDDRALGNVPAMLVYEPSLTPTISRYMRAAGHFARSKCRDALNEVCQSGIVSYWQATWMAYVAGELPRRRGGAESSHVLWLKKQLSSRNSALRAEAALALARRRLVPVSDVNEVLVAASPVDRPTVVIALAALGDEGAAMNAADSELDRLMIGWALDRF